MMRSTVPVRNVDFNHSYRNPISQLLHNFIAMTIPIKATTIAAPKYRWLMYIILYIYNIFPLKRKNTIRVTSHCFNVKKLKPVDISYDNPMKKYIPWNHMLSRLTIPSTPSSGIHPNSPRWPAAPATSSWGSDETNWDSTMNLQKLNSKLPGCDSQFWVNLRLGDTKNSVPPALGRSSLAWDCWWLHWW